MRATAIPFILIFLLNNGACAQETKSKVEILLTGTFHGGEVMEDADGQWLALRRAGEQYALEDVMVQVRPAYDSLMDYNAENSEDQSKKTGQEVVASNAQGVLPSDGATLVLIRAEGLEAGPVQTAFPYMDDGSQWKLSLGGFSPPPPISLPLGGNNYTLALEMTWGMPDALENRCELKLSVSSVNPKMYGQQTIAQQFPLDFNFETNSTDITGMSCHHPGEGFPALDWAGDLDGDGKLDLILSTGSDGYAGIKTLYLSSHAEEGKLVRRVAWFSSSSC